MVLKFCKTLKYYKVVLPLFNNFNRYEISSLEYYKFYLKLLFLSSRITEVLKIVKPDRIFHINQVKAKFQMACSD